MLIIWVLVFIVSLAVLIFAADKFTRSAERLGVFLGISSFVIGVTVVSVGTSLPELLTSLAAVFHTGLGQDATQIVIGNVLGSNIANILLIIGIVSIVAGKIAVRRSLIELDIPLLVISAGLLILISYDGKITWLEGLLLISGYAVYLKYSISEHAEEEIEISKDVRVRKSLWQIVSEKRERHLEGKVIFWLFASVILLFVGAKYTVESLIEVATILNLAPALIAVTAVAIGTSLPELVVSVVAAAKGRHEIAIGNVFGSNIFNTLLVAGIPALITPLTVPQVMISIGLPFFAAATLLYAISGISQRTYSFEGAMYLIIYLLFILKLFSSL